jgi:flagellar M-ring protein FliF
VHIARTEPSLFAGRSKDASATVAVQLRGGHRLTGANVAAIVHMVAGSVEGLTADRVVVVDSAGKLLSNQASGELARGGGSYLDYKQSVEDYFARKAEDMLAAVLGPERASVRVEATIDVADLTQTTETYDPDKRVVAKEEIKSKSSTPPATGGEGAPAGGGTREETTMSEYRVSRTVQQRRDLPGKVQSLSVAALVDLTGAAEAEGEDAPAAKLTVTDVEEIIRQATNAENIKVVDASFHQPRAAAGAEAEQAGFLNQDFLLEIAKRSSLAVLVIGALLALKLFGGSGKAKQAALPGEGQQTTVQQVGSGGSAQMRAQIAQALQQDPEQVRQLFLSWAKSDGGGE